MLAERTRAGAIPELDLFFAEELGCHPDQLSTGGMHVFSSPRRVRTGWGGYTVPILALCLRQGIHVSLSNDLLASLESGSGDPSLPEAWSYFESLRGLSQRKLSHATCISGFGMYCTEDVFRPADTAAVRRCGDDPRLREVRRRFDGELFAIFDARGNLASWSALKLKSDRLWELAVVTEPGYRGRGLARKVVSAATSHTLESGRVPLYLYDRSNGASGRVCRSLGYREYARVFFSEY